MLPDDDSYKQTQKLRRKEIGIGLALAFGAIASTVIYVTVLKSVGWSVKAALIASEWLVMFFIYLILVSKIRRRGR